MLSMLAGLDHLVIAVRDLDSAAAEWAAAGFTLSPKGLHSAHMGSGNYTMMFGEDYLELLGVVVPQPQNAPLRAFLDQREGFERVAFTSLDSDAGAAELAKRGLAVPPVAHFARPVPMPDGSTREASFSVFRWPPEEAPAGMRIFACQHHTRDAVWVPSLQTHANGATRIRRALVATPDPAAAAAHLARLIDGNVVVDGAFHTVPTGASRGTIAYGPRAAIAALAGCAETALPKEGGAAIVLGTTAPRPPAFATGVAILFEAD